MYQRTLLTHRHTRFFIATLTLIFLFAALAVAPARAAGIVVTSAADTVADDGFCTLREAIIAADTDTASGAASDECAAGSGADTITFAGDYTITLAGSQLPVVSSEMTITGNGAANTIIQAAAAAGTATYRVFEVAGGGNLTLDGVTVRHGRCAGACSAIGTSGGGILNFGILTLTNSTLSDNSSANVGGGIYNLGTLDVTNSTLSDNSVTGEFYGGGGIFNNGGTVNVTGSTLSHNWAFQGGGIENGGTLNVTNSTLSTNWALDGGGGIRNGAGEVHVINSTLSENSAGSDGGGILNYGTLHVTNSTLSGNSATSAGGGIFNYGAESDGESDEESGAVTGEVTVTRSLISGNSATAGHELANGGSGSVTSSHNVLGDNSKTSVEAFVGVTPGASDFVATSDGANPTVLANILSSFLADNGGPTQTLALVAGSPAIDRAPSADCAAAPVNGVDQRGYFRNADGNGVVSANECDAGAYEYMGTPPLCTGFPMWAGTETQLNLAITCYSLLDVAGSYTIDLTADIDLTASTVPVDNPIAGVKLLLDGQGFAVDGQNISDVRPFEIKAGSDATFDDITIMGGNVTGDGGGILNEGTLTVVNSTLSGNSATGNPDQDGNLIGGIGGGIYNNGGTVTVTNSTLSGNSATGFGRGGGIHNDSGTVTVTNSTLSGNSGNPQFFGGGGGIYNNGGTLDVTNSTLSGNLATQFGEGGGIYNDLGGTVTVTTSTLSGNSGRRAGGIYNGVGEVTVTNSTLSDNSAGRDGGGILSFGTLHVTNSTLSDNSARAGGGIVNLGTLDLTNSTLSGNSAVVDGAGISNAGGTVNVTNSTLSGNSAGRNAGGIYNEGALTVTNSTLSGNWATYGGGIYNASELSVANSTFSGNWAAYGGGIYNAGGTTTLSRSLVSGNHSYAEEYDSGHEVYNNGGSITANAYNVFGHSGVFDSDAFGFGFYPGPLDFNATNATWGFGIPVALDRILDPNLADNGGPTWTHALVAGSPAIDFGPTAGCAAAPVSGLDQRGYGRIDGNGAASANECDAGAYEFGHQPAFCTGFPMSAGTEAELNLAITCYNLLVVPGPYTINLTADIALTASTVPINHPVAGVKLLLDGQGFAVDGQNISDVRPFEIKAGSDATFDDITITGGNNGPDGGGILNYGTLAVTNSTVSGNTGVDGGGIYNYGGTLSVTNSTLSGNVARSDGGAIFNFAGTLTVTNSTLSGNKADEVGDEGGEGGGILIDGGTLTVTGSLLSGNSALLGDEVFQRWGTVTTHYNVFGHSGQSNADAFVNFSPEASDFNASSDGPTPTALTSILNTTLADNGGSTQTHALVAGSPAVDYAGACGLATDQRGVPRPQGAACDAGAYEAEVGPPSYNFSGFFAPVDSQPTLNRAKAGSAIPVKFSLGGDFGLNIFAADSPASVAIPCEGGTAIDAIEQTIRAGGSSLQYDPLTDQYTYIWKTDKAWGGTCRQLQLTLADGSPAHLADFKFTK